MDDSKKPLIEPQMKPGVQAAGSGLTEPNGLYPTPLSYKVASNGQSVVGLILARPFVAVALMLVGAQIFMPSGSKPIDHMGTAVGTFVSREQEAHTQATGRLVETQTRATVVPQTQINTLRDAQSSQIVASQLGDLACMASMFFGQGRNSAYPEVRDGLRAGCEIGAAVRENMIQEQSRLLQAGR